MIETQIVPSFHDPEVLETPRSNTEYGRGLLPETRRLDRSLRRAVKLQVRFDRALARGLATMLAGRRYQPLGSARFSDYVREHLGIGVRTVQQMTHTEERLADLPRIARAWEAGLLQSEQVRLLCRIATVETEQRWIDEAAGLSVRELSELVRGCQATGQQVPAPSDQDAPIESANGPKGSAEDEPTELVSFRAPISFAVRWQLALRLSAEVSGEDLPDSAHVENICAEYLSGAPLPSPESDPLEAEEEGFGQGWTSRGETDWRVDLEPTDDIADSEREANFRSLWLPRRLEAFLKEDPPDDPWLLHERICRLAALRGRLEARLSRLFHDFVALGGPWQAGYYSIACYAREVLGISERQARYLVWMERKLPCASVLRGEYRRGRLSALQCRLLLQLADMHVEPAAVAWVEYAKQVTVKRLQKAVEEARIRAGWETPVFPPDIRDANEAVSDEENSDSRQRQMSAHPCRSLSWLRVSFRGPADVVILWRHAISEVRRTEARPLPLWQAAERLLDAFVATWDDEHAQKLRRQHRIIERDGWRCTAPGCSSRRNLHAHHITPRSQGGSDDDWNQTALCADDHLRGVHGPDVGRLVVRGRAPYGLTWIVGGRDGGPPVMIFKGERCVFRLGKPPVSPGSRDGAEERAPVASFAMA